jgi:hypothetical protein
MGCPALGYRIALGVQLMDSIDDEAPDEFQRGKKKTAHTQTVCVITCQKSSCFVRQVQGSFGLGVVVTVSHFAGSLLLACARTLDSTQSKHNPVGIRHKMSHSSRTLAPTVTLLVTARCVTCMLCLPRFAHSSPPPPMPCILPPNPTQLLIPTIPTSPPSLCTC